MNILFCYRNWMNPKIGGVQKVSDTLAKYLVRKGNNLFYLTFIYDEEDDYQFPAKLFHLPDTDFFSDENVAFYEKLLFTLSIDLIINHDSSNDRSALWLNTGKHPAKKISLYHTDPLHGINRPANLSKFIGNYFLRNLVIRNLPWVIRYLKIQRKKREIGYLTKNSDKLVLLSEEFKKQLFNVLRITSIKIEAISNPCILNDNQDSHIKKKNLLFVGRLEIFHKRPDKMLKIWAGLQNNFPDWNLFFLGDGPDRIKVEKIAKTLELRNVCFLGFVNPDPYYQEASIICMTSDYEGFGMVLVEAMQCGAVPIVFNNWISLNDIITDQVSGVLVNPGNIDEYIQKLSKLMSNEEYRNGLSENAKESVKKFDIEIVGSQWLGLIQSL